MTKSYSNDLREKVVQYLEAGNSYDQASKLFKISVSAIGRWYRKYKKEGNYLAKKRGGSKRKIDLEALESYVKLNENMTLKKAAQKFGVSIFTISYWLKNLGFRYKKKTFPTWKLAKKDVKITRKK
ncbi:IS630 family transposase domain protein [Rickettsiales endosymbiont of Paramecium tredecaurelia]|uniref:IS630 transposase-related protein n=1 Tax=Candidatus Sarmatiella mevalonica TaxID=2770581 RepID=UPI001FC8AFAD|nr:IS630 transposase-related protein [Candidatus Sarmatiella mevalonica]MBL3284312.1 IS630 family transposase domain protein [Candidatus Sarmatiella mevalonica]